MENYEDIERTIMMAKRFFGTADFTRKKFEQYSEDIGGSSFHALYEHNAIVETGEVISTYWVLTPQEFATMVNKWIANNLYDNKWKWYINKDGNFEGVQRLTVYRMA